MSISISGSNSISGLSGNDTDFDKVLSQLKQIESIQLNRLEAWKSDWKLRYDAFTQIIDQVQAASSMLSQLGNKNNFVTKVVQSSNSNVVTAVANASAQDVQHNIKVSQVANNAIWANTGHVFESKTEVINTTGQPQDFSYTYAGKRYDFSVPANTTLDSFVSMVNNSANNPGIKISLIQTGKGYVFQVAGKSTGAVNDLIIHDSNLVGMSAAGSTSTWQTNNPLDITETVTNPNYYIFDLELQDGTNISVRVKGDSTAEELARDLNNASGGIRASVDASGNLTIKGAKSFTRHKEGEDPYASASTRFSLQGDLKDNGADIKLNDAGELAAGLPETDNVTFTVTMEDGSTRKVQVGAGATKQELLVAIAQATQPAGRVEVTFKDNGWGLDLPGVTDIELDPPSCAVNPGTITVTTTPGSSKGTMGGVLSAATTTITFGKALSDSLDAKAENGGGDIAFTLVTNGNPPVAYNIHEKSDGSSLKSGDTCQDLLDAINALGIPGVNAVPTTDASGKTTVKLVGVKEFYLSSGSVSEPSYQTSLEATVAVGPTDPNGDDLFYLDGSGKYLLEKAPDLEYTIATNDGQEYRLTIPTGTSMKDVLMALQDPAGSGIGTWTDADGNPAVPSTGWKVTFTDADGNEYVDASGNPLALDDIDGPIYLSMKDVQSVTGPGITGQVASSSNWSIQRATNARYQVDNWPIEMESDSNTISDVLEGVVLSLQEEGEARISISTDITSVEQSIQNYLDAVNSVLITVNELMKFDENKEVTSNDPDDIGNDNYSASGLTNQKGGLLTGNYGVQLFKSRFTSLLGSNPPGFQSMTSADDLLSGDLLASLANLGIKTDTDTTSDTYGLLVLAPSSGIAAMQSMDQENYDNMISNHLEAVVDFFCASGIGSSSSTDFRYGSHVEGITKGGIYEVKYTVEPDGTITNVTVGGEPAKQDFSQPGNYFSVASGDPRGLSLLIDDLTVGDHPPAGEPAMTVRIKEGLVQTTNNFLKAELVFNDVNISSSDTPQQIADALALKSKNGALMSLRDNYMTVMEGIDAKIEREQRRISTWEARQKAIFANLETLLKQYAEQQTSLESQLAQLKSD